MAQVYLDRSRGEQGDVPAHCIVCGEHARHWHTKKFYCVPDGWYLFNFADSFLGNPIAIVKVIKAIGQPDSVTLQLPLCTEHRRCFSPNIVLNLCFALGLFVGLGAIMAIFPLNVESPWLLLYLILYLIVWFVCIALRDTELKINVKSIGKRMVLLDGVSDTFAGAAEFAPDSSDAPEATWPTSELAEKQRASISLAVSEVTSWMGRLLVRLPSASAGLVTWAQARSRRLAQSKFVRQVGDLLDRGCKSVVGPTAAARLRRVLRSYDR